GELGRSVLERTTTRPTCEVVGIDVGYTEEGIKSIVPARGAFKVTFRLVPDQRPAEVAAGFERWLRERVPDGVALELRYEGGIAPCLTPVDHPAMGALSRAIARVWRK